MNKMQYNSDSGLLVKNQQRRGRPYFEAKMIHSVSGINFKIGFFEDIGGDIGSVIGGKISGSFQSEISWQW